MNYVTKCLYIYIRTFKIPTSNNRGIKFVFCGPLRVLFRLGQVLIRQEVVSTTWLSITICAYSSACSPNTLNHQLSYSKTKCTMIKQFLIIYICTFQVILKRFLIYLRNFNVFLHTHLEVEFHQLLSSDHPNNVKNQDLTFEPITPREKGSIPRVFIRYMYKAMTSMTQSV